MAAGCNPSQHIGSCHFLHLGVQAGVLQTNSYLAPDRCKQLKIFIGIDILFVLGIGDQGADDFPGGDERDCHDGVQIRQAERAVMVGFKCHHVCHGIEHERLTGLNNISAGAILEGEALLHGVWGWIDGKDHFPLQRARHAQGHAEVLHLNKAAELFKDNGEEERQVQRAADGAQDGVEGFSALAGFTLLFAGFHPQGDIPHGDGVNFPPVPDEVVTGDFHLDERAIFAAMDADGDVGLAVLLGLGASFFRFGRQVNVAHTEQFGAGKAIQFFSRRVDIQDLPGGVVNHEAGVALKVKERAVFLLTISQVCFCLFLFCQVTQYDHPTIEDIVTVAEWANGYVQLAGWTASQYAWKLYDGLSRVQFWQIEGSRRRFSN